LVALSSCRRNHGRERGEQINLYRVRADRVCQRFKAGHCRSSGRVVSRRSSFRVVGLSVVRFLSWLVVGVVYLLRGTCRIVFHNDPRPELRKRGSGYLYGFLHAHQLSVMIGSERGTAAMVSRSNDGSLIVPALQTIGCVVYRGSKKSN